MKTIISPSLLAANFANLGADIDMINRSAAGWLRLGVQGGTIVF